MPAAEFKIGNRTAYLRKAIKAPEFKSESILTADSFQYAKLWLKRNCKEALPYWEQAENYFLASRNLSPMSSPLTSYYCFLNAVKALLTVKRVQFVEKHGVSGSQGINAKRSLSNEIIKIEASGIVSSLSKYLQENQIQTEHSLYDLLANLPFIHRAFRHTFKSNSELFIPLENLVYRKHPTDNYIWFSAEIIGRYSDRRSLRTLPNKFEIDVGYEEKCIIRTKKRIKWYVQGADEIRKNQALQRLNKLHQSVRLDLSYISAPIDLWYLKRKISNTRAIDRYDMTIMIAIMHRLSELSRYDPKGLLSYFNSQANWLLTEFIQRAPSQFIDELICEMTSLEFRLPGHRP
jgi:hypothetical protein